jgi:hypothetical protein
MRWWRRNQAPLSGAPAVRRQKTYSAASGFAYQYYYLGRREGRKGTEYVFEVSADRKTFFNVCVLLSGDALEPWEAAHGRALAATERYAIAKMALYQAFDERADPVLMRMDVHVRAPDAEAILAALGID